MGTLSLLQEGNTRTDLNITDMRYAHTKLGRLLCDMYAEFGVGDRAQYFGQKGAALEEALRLYKEKTLALPIYAATASVNREVEKQNDMMLTNLARQHYQMIGTILQQVNNPMLPPEIKQYLRTAMESANTLQKMVFRHFNMDEVDRLVPAIPSPAPETGGQPSAGQPSAMPGGQPQGQPQPGGPPGGPPPGLPGMGPGGRIQ